MLMIPIIFAVVFGLNVVPVFAPPTWLVLSGFVIYFPGNAIFIFALTGAIAATLGRLTLAKLSHVVIRGKFLSERFKRNIDDLRKHLENKRGLTFSLFLFYAFSPLPSNQLFIAYGLTGLPLARIALPFFLGRLTSYTVLSLISLGIFHAFVPSASASRSFFSIYFVLSQILTVITIYLFVRIDWHALFVDKKIRFLK